MKVRFIDNQGTEYALADLTEAPAKGDGVTIRNGDGSEDKGAVVDRRWFLPSSGDPPTSPFNWDVEVVLKF